MRKTILCTLGLVVFGVMKLTAQIGGLGVYQSLSLPPSARTSALGGYQIAVFDNELSLGFQNPSLLNIDMDKQLALSQVNYLSDISFGFAGYGHSLDSQTTLLGGIQYLSYGDFERADALGNRSGKFSGGDYNIVLGVGRKWKYNLSYGINLKLIYSTLEQYSSIGLATDLAVTYHKPSKNFTAALVARNLGFQISSYSGTREEVPLDIQLGISQRLANAPFRFNITAHHLNIPDISFINPNQTTRVLNLDPGAEDEEETVPLAEKIGRHLIVGTEILATKNLHFRIGYNHQRRKELTLTDLKGAVGYSWGFGLRIWRFHVDYGRASYHLAGASNHFSITSNLSAWKKKIETPEAEG